MRLFFHFCNETGSIFDDEGVEIEDPNVAAQQTFDVIRELQNDLLECLPFRADWELRIVDEYGRLVAAFVLGSGVHGAALVFDGLSNDSWQSFLQLSSNPH
jgi:hypothetical protein